MSMIVVCGPNYGKVPVDLQKYITQAVHSYAQQLKINKFKYTLYVHVHNKTLLDREDGIEGEIEPQGDRKFRIDICLFGNWLTTLAHEMVHLKQYLRKEIDWNLSAWKGKDYDNSDYWDAPWEIEARKFQTKLFNTFIEQEPL